MLLLGELHIVILKNQPHEPTKIREKISSREFLDVRENICLGCT